jgi:hypothetical protein
MQIARLGAVLVSLSVFACGDDGGTNTIIDGGRRDSTVQVCSNALSIGTFEIDTNNTDTGYINWFAPISGTLTDGTDLGLSVEFYPTEGGDPIGIGAFDLTMGGNEDYSTCRICLVGFGGTQDAPKYYFPRAGTVNLTADPLSTRLFKATITGLIMEEVNIDGDTFESTPIATGECANIPDATVDVDAVPAEYTCDASTYTDGTVCNCMCGLLDPDCGTPGTTVTGCTAGLACAYEMTAGDQCVTRPLNDTCAASTALTLGTPTTGATTVGGDNNYDAGLETCMDYPDHDGSDVVYSVVLAADTNYSFVMTTTKDLGLALVGPGADTLCSANPITTCVAGADAENSTGDTFTYKTAVGGGGTYYVIVDSFSPAVSAPFTLTVTAQ